MANFCMKCGSRLDEQGLCPVCDAPAPVAPALKFCMKCGSRLDEQGLCPTCDAAPVVAAEESAVVEETLAVDEVAVEEPSVVEEMPAQVAVVEAATAEDTPAEEVPAEDASTPETPAEVAVAVATAEPAIETTAAPKARKKVSAWSVIGTILLSICLFITMLLSTSVLVVRRTVNYDGLKALVKELDLAELLQTSGAAKGDNMNTFYERLKRDYNIDMDDKKLSNLIDESTIPEYISDKAENFTDDFFAGEAELVITKKEMVKLIDQNRKLFEDEIPDDAATQQIDSQQVADWMFNGDELTLISTDDLQDQSPALLQTANIGLSYVALVIFLVLTALIVFAMCRISLSQAAIGGGVVCILLGAPISLLSAVVLWIPGLWHSMVSNNLVCSIVHYVLSINAFIFAILLVLGILLLVARGVIKRILKKKA